MRSPADRPRRAEGGFSLVEMVVAIAVITAISGAALTFFLGRHEQARRQVVLGQLSEAVQQVAHLPEGSPLTWQATALTMITDVMDADPPVVVSATGTESNLLPDGLHVGRTLVHEQALMHDRNNNPVTLTGCALGDLQLTMHPRRLPRFNALRQADHAWVRANLESLNPDWIIVQRRGAFFICLPGA